MHSLARIWALSYLVISLGLRAVSYRLPAANIRSRDGLCTSAASGADMDTTLPQGRSIANETMAADPATKDQQPTHLVVLVHGLSGTPEDLSYLKETLERKGGKATLVHLARCNKDKTKDGVAEGGERLAEEVKGVVESTPSLRKISLVGNSLGGLYVRYAAKLLYSDSNDDDTDCAIAAQGSDVGKVTGGGRVGGTVAGLQPAVFMSIAAPHLGVRRFTYIPVPSPLQGLAGVFVGKTGSDLFLNHRRRTGAIQRTVSTSISTNNINVSTTTSSPGRISMTSPADRRRGGTGGAAVGTKRNEVLVNINTNNGVNTGDGDISDDPLLYRMATSEEFLTPLKAFRTRRAYANRRGDFMVPYETAAFLQPNEGDGSVGSTTAIGGFADHVLGAKRGAIVGTSLVQPSPEEAMKRERVGTDEQEGDGSDNREGMLSPISEGTSGQSVVDGVAGAGFGCRKNKGRGGGTGGRERESGKEERMEEEMAAGLNSCGWQKVSVDFGGLLPFSHNKICALSRSRLARSLWGSGMNIMDHAADSVLDRSSTAEGC